MRFRYCRGLEWLHYIVMHLSHLPKIITCSRTRDKCHLLSNWETAASPCLLTLLVFWCRLRAPVGSHISITITTEEQNAKLLLRASTKLHSPAAAEAVGRTFFSFPAATKKKTLKFTYMLFQFLDNEVHQNLTFCCFLELPKGKTASGNTDFISLAETNYVLFSFSTHRWP